MVSSLFSPLHLTDLYQHSLVDSPRTTFWGSSQIISGKFWNATSNGKKAEQGHHGPLPATSIIGCKSRPALSQIWFSWGAPCRSEQHHQPAGWLNSVYMYVYMYMYIFPWHLLLPKRKSLLQVLAIIPPEYFSRKSIFLHPHSHQIRPNHYYFPIKWSTATAGWMRPLTYSPSAALPINPIFFRK